MTKSRELAGVLLGALIAFALLLGTLPAAQAQSNANVCFNVLPYAARTAATVNSATLGNPSYRGVLLTANVSTATSGNYVLHIQAPMTASPTVFYDILVSAAVASQSTGSVTLMTVYPGAPVTANVSANAVLPRTWRVQAIGTSTPLMAFGIDACLAN